MEFFYDCGTCKHYTRNQTDGVVVRPEQKMWCTLHQKMLPGEWVCGRINPICFNFEHEDPRANTMDSYHYRRVKTSIPPGGLWTMDDYTPSELLTLIADLPEIKLDEDNADKP